MQLGDRTWTDIDRLDAPILLLPVGSTEQHGPHLPLATDTIVAVELAERAVRLTEGLIVGPALTITASGEHQGFAGTLSIGTEAMTTVAVEVVRSADWAAGVVFVNGHGGNHEAITDAVGQLRADGHSVMAWWPRWPRRADGGPADLHAGRIETSLLLAIDPGLVRLELAEAGVDAAIAELRERGVRAVSPSGVLGDPAGASGREGARFIDRFVDDLVQEIERWRPL